MCLINYEAQILSAAGSKKIFSYVIKFVTPKYKLPEKGNTMNLSISPLNCARKPQNNLSFGMAKFSDAGRSLASQFQDQYVAFSKPNNLDSSIDYSRFFEKKKMFRQYPFVNYINEKFPDGKASLKNIDEVTDTIIRCGATQRQTSNAKFIKQLVAAEDTFDKLEKPAREKVSSAVVEVLDTNYDNPQVSKEDTLALVRMSTPTIDDKKKVMIDGVIVNSETGGYSEPKVGRKK